MLTIDGCNPSNWKSQDVFKNLQRGGIHAANATIAIWDGLKENIDEFAWWSKAFREKADEIVQVKSVPDIDVAEQTGRVGIILGWQNLSPIENNFERLEVFHAQGLRIAQLAYNFRNLVANGCYELQDDGISKFGRMTLKKMNELGILIDLSHVGDKSSLDAIEHSEVPVAVTHSNLREFFEHKRNKPSTLIKELVAKGGVIGANQFPRFLPNSFDSTLDDFLDAVESLIEVAGIDHVGVASDFCEGQDMEFWRYLRKIHGTAHYGDPEVPRPDPTVVGIKDASEFPKINQGLIDRGYSKEDVAKLMGQNWYRLYKNVWK